MKLLWVGVFLLLVSSKWVRGFVEFSLNETELSFIEGYSHKDSIAQSNLLMVGLTLINGAGAKQAGPLLFLIFLGRFIFIVVSANCLLFFFNLHFISGCLS